MGDGMSIFDEQQVKQIDICAQLCSIAYDLDTNSQDTKEACLKLLLAESTDYYAFPKEAMDTQALVIEKDTIIYLVFPGTDSAADAMTDAIFELVGFLSGHCHRAFLQAAQSTFSTVGGKVKELLMQKPSSKVIIVGHSLGGALAMLYAALFKQENANFPIEKLITFGQPRCGNGQFAKAFEQMNISYLRFINDGDPVPDAPPPWGKSDWTHAGKGFIFNKDGELSESLLAYESGALARAITFVIGIVTKWFYNDKKIDDKLLAEIKNSITHPMKVYCENIQNLANKA